jgi:uncharacterized protein (TIGR03437 family)
MFAHADFSVRAVCIILLTFLGAFPATAGLQGTEVTVDFAVTGPFTETWGPQQFLVGTTNLSCPLVGTPGTLCDPDLGVPYSIDFTDNAITYHGPGNGTGTWTWGTGTFWGWEFTNLNMGMPIIGVALEYSGFKVPPVATFTENSVRVNMEGATQENGAIWIVRLLVNTVTVSPTGPINFTQPQGGPAPQPLNLLLTNNGNNVQYSAQVVPVTGGSWLEINSGSSVDGTLDGTGTLVMSINPAVANSLPAGEYTSQIALSFPGTATGNVNVTVNLTVQAPSVSVTVAPTSLAFAYSGGEVTPASQPITITSTGGPVTFTATASSTGNWLSIDTSGGSTPKSINAFVNPQNLPATFNAGTPLAGMISIGAPAAQAAPLLISVTLAPPAVPAPTIVENSASLGYAPLAPGEFITIAGQNLGPAIPASFNVNAQGSVSSSLDGVQVMFDSFPGTPTYVSSTQINVAVPYEISGQSVTNLSVVYGGESSLAFPLAVAQTAPGLFTFNATGHGQAIAQNVSGPTAGTDNGPTSGVSVEGETISTSPATAGSFISVYGTGFGTTNPGATTGSVNSSTTLMPLESWNPAASTVTASIGGVPANITFIGGAPGLLNGVYQVNLQVPPGVSGDALPVSITVDGVSTPPGPTVAVQ